MILQLHCRHCDFSKQVTVDQKAFTSWWEKGELIQRAFPALDTESREMMISRTCDKCWTKMFGEVEEDELNAEV